MKEYKTIEVLNKNLQEAKHIIGDDKMYYEGNKDLINDDTLYISIVGSQKCSPYGIQVTEHIINLLNGHKNIAIISGLGYGIEGLAHTIAMKNNISTIAIPPSGIADDYIYPRMHLELKHEILENKGLIFNQFEPNTRSSVWSFPYRNKLIASLCHVVIVIEIEPNSGSIDKIDLSNDLNKKIIAIPSNIFSRNNGANFILSKHKNTTVYTDDDAFIETLTEVALQNNIYIN